MSSLAGPGHTPLDGLERWLLRLNAALVMVGIIAVVLFCLGQAIDRYSFKSRFDAYDQLARVGLVWLVFAGMAWGYAARQNLRIDLFARHLPSGVVRWRERLFETLVLLTSVLLHWKAWAVIEVSGFQPIMGTPFTNAFPYSVILLSTATMGLTALLRLWRPVVMPVMGHGEGLA
jgi:TRAP-type C4-dicarboxylate transport system permease small subunit